MKGQRLRSDLANDPDTEDSPQLGDRMSLRWIRRYYNDLGGDLAELSGDLTEEDRASLRHEHEAFDSAARRHLGIEKQATASVTARTTGSKE